MTGPRLTRNGTQSDARAGDIRTAPRMPERTRLLRPSLWVEATTARLSAEAFRAYLGLATCADDGGLLLWRPPTLAAHLYRFLPVRQRDKMLAKCAEELVEAGLLILHPCGCAEMPYVERDLKIGGGNHSYAVVDFHAIHVGTDEYVPVRTSPASVSHTASASVSGSPSFSGSESASPSSSGSPTNRPTPSRRRPTTVGDDPWTTFDPIWWPVRGAMAERGYKLPPNGETDSSGTQRDRLWQMVRENATLVAALIRDAPPDFRKGTRPFYDLVGHVFANWSSLAEKAGP